MRTLQAIFNQAYRGLRKQGWKRSIKYSRCVYRSDDGLRCAIGWAIPDERYYKSVENYSVNTDVVLQALFGVTNTSIIDNSMRYNLVDLQRCHDIAGGVPMKQRLEEFAKSRGLTVPK